MGYYETLLAISSIGYSLPVARVVQHFVLGNTLAVPQKSVLYTLPPGIVLSDRSLLYFYQSPEVLDVVRNILFES